MGTSQEGARINTNQTFVGLCLYVLAQLNFDLDIFQKLSDIL